MRTDHVHSDLSELSLVSLAVDEDRGRPFWDVRPPHTIGEEEDRTSARVAYLADDNAIGRWPPLQVLGEAPIDEFADKLLERLALRRGDIEATRETARLVGEVRDPVSARTAGPSGDRVDCQMMLEGLCIIEGRPEVFLKAG